MSRSTKALLAIKRATDSFERSRELLSAELDRGASRACLEGLVELCAMHIENTGGTLVTAAFRRQLAALHTRVQARPHLHEVQSTMQFDIEVAECCPLCQAPGHVYLNGNREFDCHCSGCYDGTEDAASDAQVVGTGDSPRAAVADWLDKAEGHLPQHVGWWPTSVAALARVEFQRTAGWVQTQTAEGIWFAPEILEAAE